MDARSIEEAWKKVTLKMEDMKEQSVLQKLIFQTTFNIFLLESV